MKSKRKSSFIEARPTKKVIEKFIRNASLSGGIWRPYEIASFSSLKMSRPILDVGCGNGSFVKTVFTNGFDYGLDILKKDLDQARQHGVYKKYLLGDAHHIPLPDKCVKTVFSNSVFEHIKNLGVVINEINRVLKIDGELIFTTHLPHSKKFNTVAFLRKLKLNFIAALLESVFIRYLQLNTLWSPDKWNEILQEKGFKVEQTKIMISDTSFFLYELFMPLTFIQNRIKFLKKIPMTKFMLNLLNINYNQENKNGYNILITARKIKSLK